MINAKAVSQGDSEVIDNLLSEQVLDAAIDMHRALGSPGLLESLYEEVESLYEEALLHDLRLRLIPVRIVNFET